MTKNIMPPTVVASFVDGTDPDSERLGRILFVADDGLESLKTAKVIYTQGNVVFFMYKSRLLTCNLNMLLRNHSKEDIESVLGDDVFNTYVEIK